MFTPERLLEILDERTAHSDASMHVYWCQVAGSRTSYAQALSTIAGERAVVPLIPQDGFNNPNALLADLARLCDANTDAFQRISREERRPLVIVLVSKSSFGLAEVSSPVVLPDCVPWHGGREVWVEVQNLEHVADGQLNAPELRVADMGAYLHDAERALVSRIVAVREANSTTFMSLFDQLKKEGEKVDGLLADCATHLRSHGRFGYRPSARFSTSLLARLCCLVDKQSLPGLQKPSKSLITALAAESLNARESLHAVMARPGPSVDIQTRQGLNILVTLHAALQISTASAHWGEYGRYALRLLDAVSIDLLLTLQSITTCLGALPPP